MLTVAHTCLLALSVGALLPFALPAQTPEPQHLLRFALEPGATQHYRKTVVNTTKIAEQESSSTLEFTFECKLAGMREGRADLEQTVRRVIARSGTNETDGKVVYDSEQGGNFMGLDRVVGTPMQMKQDDRGRLSELQLPDVIAKAPSPQVFYVRYITLPEAPVAIGKTWETTASMLIPGVGDREVKMVHRLAAVTAGKATIESAVELDAEQVELPNGGKVGKYSATTVLDLAGGKLLESRTECVWSVGDAAKKFECHFIEAIVPIAPPTTASAAPADAKTGGKE